MSGYDDYHVKIFEQELEAKQPINIGEFRLERATGKQLETVRTVAAELGYKDLRGFHMFLRSMEMNYYDILKIKYRE